MEGIMPGAASRSQKPVLTHRHVRTPKHTCQHYPAYMRGIYRLAGCPLAQPGAQAHFAAEPYETGKKRTGMTKRQKKAKGGKPTDK